ncbi:endonuclease/exonuclease/phosphatase family protein [Reichenbachiella sp.]|uniref:endonuclease/exonuclease/phosphatase family protein n=1 Tax=Reichenbachiella sp. TaxID=2184521 RepID=UPI003BB0A8B3
MASVYFYIASIIILVSLLPYVRSQHWVFRVFEFARLQLTVLQVLAVLLGLILQKDYPSHLIVQGILGILVLVNTLKLIKYSPWYPTTKITLKNPSEEIAVLSVNVYQYNTDYSKFIDLVKETQPDIILTMESNRDWEEAMSALTDDYPNYHFESLENTYGMHFFTKLEMHDVCTHFFIADDVPSMEIELSTPDGIQFKMFGVHPPPPSPSEEETSKERDGELLCVARKISETNRAVIVVGDFNSVAWSRPSYLFRKTSGLLDARIGRGFISTFHANFWWFRFPIDLFFHSSSVEVNELKTLSPIGSDHLPLYCQFKVGNDDVENRDPQLTKQEKEEVQEMIIDGKTETGNRER